jgi:glycogen synthase
MWDRSANTSSGRLFCPASTEHLAAGLRMMMLDLSRRTALMSAREAVIRELRWSKPVKRTEEMYRRALDAATEKYPPRTQRRLAPGGMRQ